MTFDCYNSSDTEVSVTDWRYQNTIKITEYDIQQAISSFPKTRYYGSKRRLLCWIHQAVRELPFTTVLDGFGGTASVSLLFKAMGKHVSFHDALLCNTISAQALLTNELTFINTIDVLSFIDKIRPVQGFISKTFSGMYYTDEENCWLDGAIHAINAINNELERSIYFYCLFQACLKKRPFNLFHRANLNLRLNRNVTRSFGNLTTWEKEFSHLMKESFNDLKLLKYYPTKPAIVLPPGDIAELDIGYDLVYLDPPYVSQSRTGDDYLRRYHFLEGLSTYNEWDKMINLTSSNKSFTTIDYISKWQSKKEFRSLLFDTIKKHKKSIVVLSYISGAYPSEEDIEEFFRSTFRRTYTLKKEFCHALAKDKKVELLFIGWH
jgi:adenine-specific DNA-methyltransferase